MASIGELLARKTLSGKISRAVETEAKLSKSPLTRETKNKIIASESSGTVKAGGEVFSLSFGVRGSGSRRKAVPKVNKTSTTSIPVLPQQRKVFDQIKNQTVKINNKAINFGDFGKDSGSRTSILRRADGSIEFGIGNNVVAEISPQGKRRVRIAVGTPGKKRIKKPRKINKITALVLVEQKIKSLSSEKRLEQIRLTTAMNLFLKKQGVSVDPNFIKIKTIKPIIKNGKVWGYVDKAAQITVGFSSPITVQEILRIDFERQTPKKVSKKNQIEINGAFYTARTKEEQKFLEFVKQAVIDKNEFNKSFLKDLEKRNLTIRDTDKWFQKALKGSGIGFASIKSLPKQTLLFIKWIKTQVLSAKAVKSLKKKGLETEVKQAKAGFKQARRLRAKQIPSAIGQTLKGFNPVKPENWFNLAVFIASAPASVKPVKNTINKFKKSYIPSTRNTNAFKNLALKQINAIRKAKLLVKNQIKSGSDITLNKVLLKRIVKTETTLANAYKKVEKALANPGVLKLNDFNPLVNSVKLIKKFGTKQFVTHATAAKVSKLFGQRFKVLKPVSEILKKVEKVSGTAKRVFKATTEIEEELLKIIKLKKGVISGGKAQNLFVKKKLIRKTQDYDVLIKNHREIAFFTIKRLKAKFPKSDFKMKIISPPNIKFKVYRIIANKKDLVDFDPLPLDLGTPVKVNGFLVANPKFLAKRKASTIGDVKKTFRQEKDIKDLQRLTGSVFSDAKLFNKVKNAPDQFTVLARPKSMGADRIRFGETEFFWDLEVPTSYAYNALGTKSLTQKVLSKLSKFKLPLGFKAPGKVTLNPLAKKFIQKINTRKFIKSNSKVTVIRMQTKISGLPKQLSSKVKKASGLSVKEQNKLRVDIGSWIKKKQNFKKVMGGSRTLSKGFGEREFVTPVGAKLFKQSIKKSFDKETNTFINVIDVAFTKSKKKSLLLDKLRLASFKDLKNNFFTPADFLKVKKFKKALDSAEKLSKGDYNDIVTVTLKMLRSKKAKRNFSSLNKKETEIVNLLRAAKRNKVTRIRSPSLRSAISLAGVRRIFKSRSVKRPRVKPRSTKRVVSKSRSVKRPRVKPRSTKRVVSKSRPRVKPRSTVRPRVVSRPRVKPRTTKRVVSKSSTKKKKPVKKGLLKKTKSKKVFPGYFAFAFQGGKPIKLNSKPLTRQNALSLAARAADKTTGATAFIRGTNKKAVKKRADKYFETNKKRFSKGQKKRKIPNLITEKNKFRINSVGEKKGITVKGWVAARKKKASAKTKRVKRKTRASKARKR